MFKYLTSTTVKSVAISFALYIVVVVLTLFESEAFWELFFGKILLVLIYVGPFLILAAAVLDIIRERQRSKNGNGR
jgi:hypothetical protein